MMKAPSAKRIIGAAMMIIGGVPLFFIILILLLYSFCLAPTIVHYCVLAVIMAVLALSLREISRRAQLVVIGIALVLSCWWGITAWNDRNQLGKYGVSYNITCGEHAEYQTVWFYWDRNGKRIDGPTVNGEELYIQFKNVEHKKVPEIVVRSETHEDRRVTLKLNFNDSTKPEFELVGAPGLQIEYCVPWGDYYDAHETTKE
jgi:hypothetical protein